MRVQNKKTLEYYDITKDQWAGMKKRSAHLKYNVIDDSDERLTPQKIEIKEIFKEEEVIDEEKITDVYTDSKDDIEFYRLELDNLGIKYHPREGIVKLKKKYEEATNNE